MNEAFLNVEQFRDFAEKINMSMAIFDVLIERHRQRAEERFTHEHDDRHINGELAAAAACYTLASLPLSEQKIAEYAASFLGPIWPWRWSMWKPKSPRENLVKAAAMMLAEIERLDRMVADPGRSIA